MIAALYVETNGCYFGLPGVDPWDITRDARTYPGPYPVVAHPPCERWGRFADGGMGRGLHTPGDDGGCFTAALASIRRWGGVLEHPKDSKAFAAHGIPHPPKVGWLNAGWCEWVCQVEQGHYGHPGRKATWLLFVGPRPPELIWGPSPQRLPARRLAERGYESARRCGAVANLSHNQRQRTPPAFRELLLSLVEDNEIQITRMAATTRRLRDAIQNIADKETMDVDPDVYAYAVLNPD